MFGGGGGSVIMRCFYTGTSGIILHRSSVIYRQGTCFFKSANTSKSKDFNSAYKTLSVGHSPHNLLRGQ